MMISNIDNDECLKSVALDSRVLEIKVSGIDPVGRHPEDILSNLCRNSFCLDDVQCESMDNFLRSLAFRDIETQVEVCFPRNRDISQFTVPDWQTLQTLWWQGKPIDRQSAAYLDFIYNAYREMFLWSGRFRDVLMSTDGKQLAYHSGNDNSHKCILTDEEFCKILMELRERNKEEYKENRYSRRWPNCVGMEEDYI